MPNDVTAQPAGLVVALEELWAARDTLSEVDDCAAAQVHAVYNRFIVPDDAA